MRTSPGPCAGRVSRPWARDDYPPAQIRWQVPLAAILRRKLLARHLAGNLQDQLAADGIGEILEAARRQAEGAGAADDIGLVVFIELAEVAAPVSRAIVVGDDRQAVDDDAARQGGFARCFERAAIVGPVAGNID